MLEMAELFAEGSRLDTVIPNILGGVRPMLGKDGEFLYLKKTKQLT